MTDSNKGKHRALLILGMHRSGTSAVTRIVNLLGARIGGSLVPAGKDNPSGFWEPEKVVKINDDLLRSLGRTWYDMREMPSNWVETAMGQEAFKRAKAFIRHEMSNESLWVIKDPRLCLTAPVWIKALTALGFEVDCLFVVRDPREVVDSLHVRNDWPRSPLYLMWVQYLIEAEAASSGNRRAMVTYDQILGNWRASMERIAKEFHLAWPIAVDEAAAAIDAFLDRNQRHHQAHGDPSTESLEVPELVRLLYASCLETARGKPGWHAIAKLRDNFRSVASLYAEHVDTLLVEKWNAVGRADTAESKLAQRESMERTVEQTVKLSQDATEAGLARLAQDIATLAQQVRATYAEQANRCMEQASMLTGVQTAIQQSRDEAEARLARVAETLVGKMQANNTEQIAKWADRASVIAGIQTTVQRLQEAFETETGLMQQKLSDAAMQMQHSASEIDGRILRHQQSLQAVEARLQRQYELLNTVSLRLEQFAGDRLAERISGLSSRFDGVHLVERLSALSEKVDALHGAEIQGLQSALVQRDVELRQRDAALQQRDLVLRQRDDELLQSDARLTRLLGSTSWRITKPLRWLSMHVMRRPRGD